jgi:hypothetical protein
MTEIGTLPNEVNLQIISYLNLSDSISLASTNKRYRQLIGQSAIWREALSWNFSNKYTVQYSQLPDTINWWQIYLHEAKARHIENETTRVLTIVPKHLATTRKIQLFAFGTSFLSLPGVIPKMVSFYNSCVDFLKNIEYKVLTPEEYAEMFPNGEPFDYPYYD